MLKFPPRPIASACVAVLAVGLASAAAARAAACNGQSLFEAEYYVTAIPASCVAAGDWNEDGRADVAVASVCDACIRWGRPFVPAVITLLGEGNFRIGSRTEIPLEITPRWVVARDMDGDGHQDLVVTGNGGTRILAGDGTGRFHETEAFADAGSHVTVGDLDGDGRPDIVLAPLRDQLHPAPYVPELSIILRGTGERLALPGGWFFSALADFDHDGDLDLVSYGARVWLNDGHARFSGPTSYSTGCDDYIAADDVNGDGHPDLFGVGGGQYSCDMLLLGNGDGTFHAGAVIGAAQRAGIVGPEGGPTTGADPQEPPQSPRHVPQGPGFVVLVDLNGDGKADPVRIGTERGHELNGRRSIGDAQMGCAADMDLDGKSDVIVAGFNGIAIHPGTGDGSFRSNPSTWTHYPPQDVVLADLDGDGRRDVAMTSIEDELVVALTAPDGGFERIVRQFYPSSGDIEIADFDGDGRADLLDADDDLYLGNGDGTFRTPAIATAAFGVPGDFDEDGHMDLASPKGHAVQFFLGNGDGTFRSGSSIAVEALNLEVADVDHDGHMDLVTAAPSFAAVVYGRGDGTAAEIVPLPVEEGRFGWVSMGHLDRDGLLDFIVPSLDGGAVYLSRGRTFARSPYQGAPTYAVVGDLNGDGISDLMAGGVWVGHGDGTFDPPDVLFGPGGITRLDDRNGDGLDDVVVAGSYDEDGYYNTLTLIMNRSVRNRAPVTAGARATVARTWPPNGEFANVAIEGVADPDGDPVSITCLGVTQDEPVTGGWATAGAKMCGDAIIDANGQARVRLARDGSGNGRVYEIAYSATDACGTISSGRVRVEVPHDLGKVCVDDGQRFNSLACVSRFAKHEMNGDSGPLAVERLAAGRWAIRYTLAAPADVQLDVFDLLGRRIASLESGRHEPGTHDRTWTPSTGQGVFFVRLTRNGETLVRRCILVD